jgi:hypothetical protein
MVNLPPEFLDASQKERGELLAEIDTEIGVKGIVLRGGPSLCAYIGIPKWHPLAGLDYNDIPLDVHGGLTFGDLGDGEMRPAEYFWYGWDYGHAGDLCFYDVQFAHLLPGRLHRDEHPWTPTEVTDELKAAMIEFRWLYFIGWIPLRIKLAIRCFVGK